MGRIHVLAFLLAALMLSAFVGPPAALSEPFLDLYAGGTYTQRADVTFRAGGTPDLTMQNAKFNASPTGGARLGVWLPQLPFLGLGVDAFYFTTNIPPQTFRMCMGGFCGTDSTTATSKQGHVAVALDVMLRAPLGQNEEFPNGRFQPYLTVGPALFFSSWDEPGFTQARTTTVGFKGGAGAKLMVTKMVGLFGEYRVTHFKPEQDFQASGVSFTASNTLTTHHLVFGLSVAFN